MTLPHICFIGRMGSGKTTAAELLVKHFGYERLSFAQPLKVGVGSTTDRGLLQTVGVGVRELCPDFWVNLLVADLNTKSEPGSKEWEDAGAWPPRFVVDDCRFPNEAFKLKVEGFVIVRVWADRGERVLRLRGNGKLQDEAQLEHESETALDDLIPDYDLNNSGTGVDLLNDLAGILNREQR